MRRLSWGLLPMLALTFGCEDILDLGDDGDGQAPPSMIAPGANETPDTGSAAAPDPAPRSSGGAVPADFAGVRWLHTNVAGWPQTTSLKVSVGGGAVNLNYGKKNAWPARSVGGTPVNANPWIFVNRDGVWYAATWEWLRPGQTSKSAAAVSGSHIKKAPLNNFRPVSGEVYGFMVSGLARTGTRNVEERSNVVMVRWP